jgi:hypothetical protein
MASQNIQWIRLPSGLHKPIRGFDVQKSRRKLLREGQEFLSAFTLKMLNDVGRDNYVPFCAALHFLPQPLQNVLAVVLVK